MHVFTTGTTGYIGGSVAAWLVRHGVKVSGLVRTETRAAELSGLGIRPVLGDLYDAEVLRSACSDADVVINAASADNPYPVATFLQALAGTGKRFIHTSGSSIAGDLAYGEPSGAVYDESTMPPIRLEKRGRVALDRAVLEAADTGIVASVICPTMIYGPGLGLKPESAQVPMLISAARRRRGAAVVGRGLNRWANVHIEDLCELYRLLATSAVPRGFYFAENGEAALIDIARSINAAMHTSDEPTSLSIRESIALWGPESASYALGSNSRVRARNAKAHSWKPKHDSLFEDVARLSLA
jgi:nucleoside-diphosphate-sugar epimerase